MKKFVKIFSIIMASVLGISLLSAVAIFATKGGSGKNIVPKFTAMTIERENPLTTLSNENGDEVIIRNLADGKEETLKDTTQQEPNVDSDKPTLDEDGNKPQKDIDVPNDDMDDDDDDDDKDIEDISPSKPGVDMSGDTLLYASVNEEVYIAVSLINPDSLPIISFTLNGNVYQSYQFERGSTSTLLILKVNSGEIPGIVKTFTLDEMKYVDDDNDIEDAIIEGNPTVKLQVGYDKLPTVDVINKTITYSSYEAELRVTDVNALIDKNSELKVELSDGKRIIYEKLLYGNNEKIVFDNLKTGIDYQYMVTANFDDLSAKGYVRHTLLKQSFRTTNATEIKNVESNKDSISFDYNIVNNSVTIKDIILFDNLKNPVSKVVNGNNKFIELLSNHDYEVRIYYEIKIGYENLTLYDSFNIKTKGYKVPTIDVVTKVDETTLSYEILQDNQDDLMTITSIDLYHKDGNLTESIKDPTVNDLTGEFTNLKYNSEYLLQVSYTYDLNDGRGLQLINKKVAFRVNKAIPTIKIETDRVDSSSINFDVIYTDDNAVAGQIETIKLFEDDNKFIRKLKITDRFVSGLKSNTNYTIKITLPYDLNDGRGTQYIEASKVISTAKETPTLDVQLDPTKETINVSINKDDKDNSLLELKIEAFLTDDLSYSIPERTFTSNELLDNVLFDEITDLLSNKEYLVKLTYLYDTNDLTGEKTSDLDFKITTFAKEIPTISLTTSNNDFSSFEFELTINDPDNCLFINNVTLKLGDTVVEERSYSEFMSNKFTNLYSNNPYTVEVNYSYDLNDGELPIENSISKEQRTKKHKDISYDYTNMLAGKDYIEFDYKINDANNFSQITDISIFKGNQFINRLDDLTLRKFEGLDQREFYTIVTTYEYNLNDGKGVRTDKISIKYGTSGSTIFINSMEVINNQFPAINEKVEVRVSVDNPNDIDITALIISGERAEITNNDPNNLIVSFKPSTKGGSYNVEVTGYEYKVNDMYITADLTSAYSEDIIIRGDLIVEDFYVLSDSNYVGLTDTNKYIIELNNPTGYKLESIFVKYNYNENENEIKDIVKLDDNHYLVTIDNYYHDIWEKVELTKITYSLEGYTIDKPFENAVDDIFSCEYLKYDKIVHIKSVEDLLNINENKNENIYYILDTDLDLKNYKWSGVSGKGYFNGNNHTISNITISIQHNINDTSYGLFKTFAGAIVDLNVDRFYYSINTSSSVNVGGIVGNGKNDYINDQLKLINCSVSNGDIRIEGNGVGASLTTTAKDIKNCLVKNITITTKEADGYLLAESISTKNDDGTYGCAVIGKTYVKKGVKEYFKLYMKDEKNLGAKLLGLTKNVDYRIVTNTNLRDYVKNSAYINDINIYRDGYTCEWYDNQEFEGLPVTFPYFNQEKPDLYCKWTKKSIAEEKYEYRRTSIKNEITKKYVEGYEIVNFGELKDTQLEFTVGGYHKGLPVISVSYEATKFITRQVDHNGQWTEKPNAWEEAKKYTFIVTDTILEYYNIPGNIYHNDTTLFNGGYRDTEYFNIKDKAKIEEKYPGYDYCIKYYYDTNNPYLDENKVKYEPTNEDNNEIIIKGTFIERIEDDYKFVTENTKFSIEYTKDNKYKFFVVNGEKIFVYHNRVYRDIKDIHEDQNFLSIIYNNNDVEVIEVLNRDLKFFDFNQYELNVTKLGDNLFIDNRNISSITLPNTLKEIGESCFQNMKITGITIPSSVTKIGRYAFSSCDQLSKVEFNANIDTIEEGLFNYCYNLNEIKIPETVKYIRSNAFNNCNQLNEFTIPENVLEIGDNAFADCDGNFYIHDKVEKIGKHAFYYNSGYQNIFVYNLASPKEGWDIDFTNFKTYYGIKEVKNKNNIKYAVNNNNEVIIIKNTLNSYGTNYLDSFDFVEGDVVEIANNANINLMVSDIPTTVRRIGRNAISSVQKQYVYIPNTLLVLEADAFNSSIKIYTQFTSLPNTWDYQYKDRAIFGVKGFDEDADYKYLVYEDNTAMLLECKNKYQNSYDLTNLKYKIVELGDYLFRDSSAESIILPNTLQVIGSNCFNNSSIKNLIIPESVTRIKNNAFDCWNLEYIYIPSSVEIDYRIFGYNPNQNLNVFFGIDAPKENWSPDYIGVDSKQVYYGIKEIKNDGNFVYAVTKDNEVIVIKGLNYIENKTLSFMDGNVTTICKGANINCYQLTIPNTVTRIGYNAFNGGSVYIPNSVIEFEGLDYYITIYTNYSSFPENWNHSVENSTIYYDKNSFVF